MAEHAAHLATAALHEGSRTALVDALARYAAGQSGPRDSRDVMIGLAPFYDCAHRLGFAPAEIFDDAADASDATEPIAQLLRTFGRRSDVTLNVFGWELVQRAGMPSIYWFALLGGQEARPYS